MCVGILIGSDILITGIKVRIVLVVNFYVFEHVKCLDEVTSYWIC